MTVSREEIMAYVDGEADAATRSRIDSAAHDDPALARQIDAERALREQLRGHFAGLAAETVPPRWEAMIRAAVEPDPADRAATVVDLAAVRSNRHAEAPHARSASRTRMWFGAALAASLVLGLFVGTQLQTKSPFLAEQGALVARGDLAAALDTQLASAQVGAPVRMLATFRNRDGDLCRAFSGPEASGIACHSGSSWRLLHVLPGVSADRAEYRQARSEDVEVMALAQQMAVGDPLDSPQEEMAKEHGWR